ncbi:MAG: SAM-dependent methyltransferase, partial [Stackebrandtia sp.]
EWLDNVPCDVAVLDETGTVRYQLVAPATGETGLGPPITSADADWLAAWWPLTRPGDRAEIGRPRDLAWQGLLDRLTRGAALAIDYGHTRATRPALGSLTGYLAGRQVPAIPDGSRDITAHVAMDSLGDGMLRTQRDALRDLGIHGARPSLALAHHDPADYLRRLQTASVTAELTDPGGLGAHYWYTVLVD